MTPFSFPRSEPPGNPGRFTLASLEPAREPWRRVDDREFGPLTRAGSRRRCRDPAGWSGMPTGGIRARGALRGRVLRVPRAALPRSPPASIAGCRPAMWTSTGSPAPGTASRPRAVPGSRARARARRVNARTGTSSRRSRAGIRMCWSWWGPSPPARLPQGRSRRASDAWSWIDSGRRLPRSSSRQRAARRLQRTAGGGLRRWLEASTSAGVRLLRGSASRARCAP